MADFTAQDVQRLRQMTGAGMMDSKRALVETEGDFDSAAQWLREKGLASSVKRSDRESSDGAAALVGDERAAAIVELRCETDFVAKSADFVNLANDIASVVASKGLDAASEYQEAIDELKLTLKENISLGRVVRMEADQDAVLGTYLHLQSDRGKNAVLVKLAHGDLELAHDIAVHIAFARPRYLSRTDVDAETLEIDRSTFEALARNEGKPEAALPKIVEGRVNGFYKENCLLEQPFVKNEKQTIAQLLGDATIVEFAQVEIGR